VKAFSIGWVNIRRMLRERSNIFFVFIFPLAIILLVGVQFGGDFDPAVAVYLADDGEIAEAIATEIEANESLNARRMESEDDLIATVERGSAQAGVFLPAAMDDQAGQGEVVAIGLVTRPDGFGPQLESVIRASVAEVMKPIGAAQFASSDTGVPFGETLGPASANADSSPGVGVEVSAVGDALFPDTLGRFDLGAAQQLVLFTFLTALAGSAALILTRQQGLSHRMLSTPTSVGTVVVGESLGRFGVALFQGLYIIVLTLVIFGVNWGNPIGAMLIILTFSAVGAGAGVLMGATFSNDQQASGVGVVISLGLAALGGCMLPIELFSPTMQKVAHITPHAWALDGFAELVRHGGSPVDILPELGVLTAYATVLLVLAGWRLRVAITRP